MSPRPCFVQEEAEKEEDEEEGEVGEVEEVDGEEGEEEEDVESETTAAPESSSDAGEEEISLTSEGERRDPLVQSEQVW